MSHLNQLPVDALRAMHSGMTGPVRSQSVREALRREGEGFHVETPGGSQADRSPVACDAAPTATPRGRVIMLSFRQPAG